MSQLIYTESGRPMIGENEEISRWRWVRKDFKVPAAGAAAPAELWLNIALYDGNKVPLEVELNGKALGQVRPADATPKMFNWIKLDVPRGRVKAGVNRVVLRSANPAMNAWIVAVENGHAPGAAPASALSTDRGQTWRSHAMGIHGMLRGEYIIRLRVLADRLKDPTPPPVVYEDPRHPRVRELLDILPAAVRRERDPWQQMLKLRTFVAKSWSHDPFFGTYAPWDPWTVMDWGHRKWCHGRRGKVTMCVHYGAVMASFAAALGHKARCVVVTSGMNTPEGHFMTEVWDQARGQWVLHDPNIDIHYQVDGRPLAALDVAERSHLGLGCKGHVCKGPGVPKGPRRLTSAVGKLFVSGKSFRLSGIWRRGNYISDTTACPPNHGSLVYAETDFVWYVPKAIDGQCAMFPYRLADRSYFDAAPGK